MNNFKTLPQKELNALALKILPFLFNRIMGEQTIKVDPVTLINELALKVENTTNSTALYHLRLFLNGTNGEEVNTELAESVAIPMARLAVLKCIELTEERSSPAAAILEAQKYNVYLACKMSGVDVGSALQLVKAMFGHQTGHVILAPDRNPYSSETFNPSGGSCFVATACYGESEILTTLRNWRDQQTTGFGKTFVDFYYSGFGEYTASVLQKFPLLKIPARFAVKTFLFFIGK